MLLELILGLVVTAGIGALLQLKYKHWKFSHIPGPPRQSFLYGNVNKFRKSIREEGAFGAYWLHLTRQYGIIFSDWFFFKPIVFLAEPHVIKELVTDFKLFPRPDDQNNIVSRNFSIGLRRIGTTRFCGNHSILTDYGGPIWRHKKKIMDPAFSIQRLTAHLSRFVAIANSLVDAVASKPEGSVFDMHLVVAPFTIDAISSAGFSASTERQAELRRGNATIADILVQMFKGDNAFTMLLKSDKRKALFNCSAEMQKIRDIGKDMIYSRTSDGSYGQVHDLLDYIITANMDATKGSLDLEDCLDDFMTMYGAGNATTSTTLLWTLAELTRHPYIMDRLVEEIDTIWTGANIDEASDPGYIGDTLKQMKYLEAVIKEILRLHPPVQFVVRLATTTTKMCGYNVPAGAQIQSSQFVMHRWEKYWEDPDKFDPDRFLTSTPKPFTYFPFFMGPRQCIGKNFALLELKCMVCELLKTFAFVKDPATPTKIHSKQAILCIPIQNQYLATAR